MRTYQNAPVSSSPPGLMEVTTVVVRLIYAPMADNSGCLPVTSTSRRASLVNLAVGPGCFADALLEDGLHCFLGGDSDHCVWSFLVRVVVVKRSAGAGGSIGQGHQGQREGDELVVFVRLLSSIRLEDYCEHLVQALVEFVDLFPVEP